jgi:hypothetical protein
MPKKSSDYSKTIIYKIICKDLNIVDLYVGHTTAFVKRKSCHKKRSISENALIYETIRNNGGWDNWDMIEIEKFPCVDGNEARARERHWYDEFMSKLNLRKPLTTPEEYIQNAKDNYLANKEEENKKCKDYYYANKERINQRNNERRRNVKYECLLCGVSMCLISKIKHEKTKKHLSKLI